MEASLAQLLQRLEVATNRLESAAEAVSASTAASSGSKGVNPGTAGSQQQNSPLRHFDEHMEAALNDFMAKSSAIGPLCVQQAEQIQAACKALRQIIAIAYASRKPADESIATNSGMYKPLQDAIAAVANIREANRTSPLFHHLSMIGEGSMAFGWVLAGTAPAGYIGEMKDAATFYANRVKKDFREQDVKHVEWVDSFVKLLSVMQAVVKSHFTTGLVWNPNGEAFEQVVANSTALVGTPTTVHTQPSAPVAKPTPAKAAPVKKPAAAGPPKTELVGNRWLVENHTSGQVILDKVDKAHAVYVYNCGECAIQICGKVNAVSLDKCNKTGLVLDTVVSNIELINSSSVQLQVNHLAPTITLNNIDGGTVYLSKESQTSDIFSSKCTALNVILLDQEVPDDQPQEMPVPEQFLTRVVDGKLVTTAVSGH